MCNTMQYAIVTNLLKGFIYNRDGQTFFEKKFKIFLAIHSYHVAS